MGGREERTKAKSRVSLAISFFAPEVLVWSR